MSRKMYLTADDYTIEDGGKVPSALNSIIIHTYTPVEKLRGATIEITLPEPEKTVGAMWHEHTRKCSESSRRAIAEDAIASLLDDVAALKKERAT